MEKDEIVRFIAEWQNRILRIQGIDREYLHALQETIGSRPIKNKLPASGGRGNLFLSSSLPGG